MARPTWVEAQSASGSSAAGTLTVPDIAGLAVGDFLAVYAGFGNNSALSAFPTSNWTTEAVRSSGTTVIGLHDAQWAWKIAEQADIDLASFTFTQSPLTAKTMILVALRGAHQTSPRNGIVQSPIDNSTSYPSPIIVPTVSETLLLMGWGSKASTATVTAATANNLTQVSRTNVSSAIGTADGPASGQNSAQHTATFSVTDGGSSSVLAIAPVAGDTTPPANPTGLTASVITVSD